MKFSPKSLLLTVAMIATMILTARFAHQAYQRYVGVMRTGVTARTANLYLSPSLKLPESASDVTYYVDFGQSNPNLRYPKMSFSLGAETAIGLPILFPSRSRTLSR